MLACDIAEGTSHVGRLAQMGAGTDPFFISLTKGQYNNSQMISHTFI